MLLDELCVEYSVVNVVNIIDVLIITQHTYVLVVTAFVLSLQFGPDQIVDRFLVITRI